MTYIPGPKPVPTTKPTWIKVVEVIAWVMVGALAIVVTVAIPGLLCLWVPLGVVLFIRWARRGPPQPRPPMYPPAD